MVAQDNGQNLAHWDLGKLYGLNGPALIKMDEVEFLERDPVNGTQWYRALRKILDRRKFPGTVDSFFLPSFCLY